MDFNERLLQLRKEKGLSQEELGYELDVSRQTISKWEMGQTTPEMDKLIELSSFFDISIDELVGIKEVASKDEAVVIFPSRILRSYGYEYKSKKMLFGLPLVHINIGLGIRKAKGIVAIGTLAKGIVTLGVISTGVVSLGVLSLGLISLGAIGLGVLAVAGLAVGALAIGGISIGLFAIGGLSVGVYALGGFASASRVARGGYAKGHIAIGDKASGEFVWENITKLTKDDYSKIRETILREYPNTLKWILNLFVS